MADTPKRPDHMPTSLLKLWQDDPDVRRYMDGYESKLHTLQREFETAMVVKNSELIGYGKLKRENSETLLRLHNVRELAEKSWNGIHLAIQTQLIEILDSVVEGRGLPEPERCLQTIEYSDGKGEPCMLLPDHEGPCAVETPVPCEHEWQGDNPRCIKCLMFKSTVERESEPD